MGKGRGSRLPTGEIICRLRAPLAVFTTCSSLDGDQAMTSLCRQQLWRTAFLATRQPHAPALRWRPLAARGPARLAPAPTRAYTTAPSSARLNDDPTRPRSLTVTFPSGATSSLCVPSRSRTPAPRADLSSGMQSPCLAEGPLHARAVSPSSHEAASRRHRQGPLCAFGRLLFRALTPLPSRYRSRQTWLRNMWLRREMRSLSDVRCRLSV